MAVVDRAVWLLRCHIEENTGILWIRFPTDLRLSKFSGTLLADTGTGPIDATVVLAIPTTLNPSVVHSSVARG